MDIFKNSDLKELIADRNAPCVSIYAPTQKGGKGLDLSHWKYLLENAERQLTAWNCPAEQRDSLLDPAYSLLKDEEFWKYTSEGLALFIAPEFLRAYRLPIPFAEKTQVSHSFYIKPLIPWVQDDGRFYILALSQNHVRLLEATRHAVHELKPGAPTSKAEANQNHEHENLLNLHTHHDAAGKAMHAVFHSQGGDDTLKKELLHFFQKIDHAICGYLGNSQAPLIVATVEYMLPIYREASKYAHLLNQGIAGNPDHWNATELQSRALPLVEPIFEARTTKAVAKFHEWAGSGLTTPELDVILPAAKQGNLQSLLLVPDQDIWGNYDAQTQTVEVHQTPEPGDAELGNLAAIYTLQHNHAVHSVAPQKFFDGSPVMGVYFYARLNNAQSRAKRVEKISV